MKYTTVGVAIAKNVFELHWMDAGAGEVAPEIWTVG
jgi:transposase